MTSHSAERRLRNRLLMMVAVAALGVGIVVQLTDGARRAELSTVDLRFDLRGEREAPRDLAVVKVDDDTFSELREQWPFPRSLHADLVDRLRRDGAKVIAYDVQFTERTEQAEDDALIEAIARAGNVVLATTEVDDEGAHAILGGEELLREIGARGANAVLPPDPGGVLRRVPYEVDGLKTFGVVVAERAGRKPVDEGAFEEDGAWIDYPGPPDTIPAYSFGDVVKGRVPAGTFKGKVVVVGASAPSLQDIAATSSSGAKMMAGAEIQAAAFDTVRRGLSLRGSNGLLDVAIVLLLGLLVPLASLRFSPLRALAVGLAAVAAYLAIAYLAFEGGTILPVVTPLGTFALAAVGALAVGYVTELFGRERTRDAFARFVPEAVVHEAMERAGTHGWLEAENIDATVLFSDLRGFTTFSEGREPDVVLGLLNRYLAEMSDVIMSHGGTVVGYLGDGIIAVFGAPLADADHADHALAAAREMLDRLEDYNAWATTRGVEEPFRMGVGLNAGPIMAGNVGSTRRMEYTVIGDTANTASRIEGMTKGSGYSIFLAESVRERLSDPPDDVVFVAEREVRGRREPVRVWAVEAPAQVPAAHPPGDLLIL